MAKYEQFIQFDMNMYKQQTIYITKTNQYGTKTTQFQNTSVIRVILMI